MISQPASNRRRAVIHQVYCISIVFWARNKEDFYVALGNDSDQKY